MNQTFTLEQANKTLPLVRPIMADVMETWEQIIYKRTKLDVLEKGTLSENELIQLKEDLNYLIDNTNRYIKEIEQLGCYVEQFTRGVVNFPSLYHGRKVFLCWMPTDSKVEHWHELDETCNVRVKL
jgi:hypothetical protein